MAVIRRREYLYPKFIEMYNAGMSDYDIASELGYTSGSIARWRNEYGLPCHSTQWKRSKLKPHKDEIIAMRKDGMTFDQIAAKVGATKNGVRKFYRKLGISA